VWKASIQAFPKWHSLEIHFPKWGMLMQHQMRPNCLVNGLGKLNIWTDQYGMSSLWHLLYFEMPIMDTSNNNYAWGGVTTSHG
jgi:hypothetical protein